MNYYYKEVCKSTTNFKLEFKGKLKEKIQNDYSNIREIINIDYFNWYLRSGEYIDMFSPKNFILVIQRLYIKENKFV
ncbi:hypothetical protein E0494_04600 [Marinilabiliaceae bacterium JC040]|nr:hypothetical protein [Marinilabiliaceae bacterium JC040]